MESHKDRISEFELRLKKSDQDKIKIGTMVIVQLRDELLMGKVTSASPPTWTVHRWQARNRSAPGLNKRFFPSWEKSGRTIVSAHPPRGSVASLFNFNLSDLVCSGFSLNSSVPEDRAVDFAQRRGFTAALVDGPDGSRKRTVS